MPLIGEILYAETNTEIREVVALARAAGDLLLACGLDTEFYNLDIGKQSCAARARVHLISLGIPKVPVTINPRGTLHAQAVVLPSGALSHPAFRAWLASPAIKAIHNMPVDLHALRNMGVEVGGAVNTLGMARWAWSDRARGAGFGLDSLGCDLLGVGKLLSFGEIFSEEYEEWRIRTRVETACECGAVPCRKRSSTPGHDRVKRVIETRIPKVQTREIPLESVIPGHPRWEQALEYSAQDAILALGVYELALSKMRNTRIEAPWLHYPS